MILPTHLSADFGTSGGTQTWEIQYIGETQMSELSAGPIVGRKVCYDGYHLMVLEDTTDGTTRTLVCKVLWGESEDATAECLELLPE